MNTARMAEDLDKELRLNDSAFPQELAAADSIGSRRVLFEAPSVENSNKEQVDSNDQDSDEDSDEKEESDSDETVTGESRQSIDELLENLETAAEQAIETKDYLSYSTLLDVYLGDPNQHSDEDSKILLEKLLEILAVYHELTYEIGWDLPALLITYIESSDYHPEHGLGSGYVRVIIKIFEILALYGNPKELFLKACELLSTIRITKLVDPDEDAQMNRERMFDVKIYCLLEMITTCSKRISTLYPSRFLSMAVTSILNNYNNNEDMILSLLFSCRKYYIFARDYVAPLRPNDPDDTQQALDDENYLQRKLLTSYLTHIVEFMGKKRGPPNSIRYYGEIQTSYSLEIYKGYFGYVTSFTEIYDRYTMLSLSYDIDLYESFDYQLNAAESLFDALNYKLSTEDLSSQIFDTILSKRTKETSLLSEEGAVRIKDSELGKFLLFTQYVVSERKDDVKISLSQAIKLYLVHVLPGVLHPSFLSVSAQDSCALFLWYTISHSTQAELVKEISSLNHTVLRIFFQTLISIANAASTKHHQFVILTLFAKLLTYWDETSVADFLFESLRVCPFEKIKPAVIGVLKDLLIRDRIDALGDELAALDLGNESNKKPALPPRNSKYINLTKQREEILWEFVMENVSSTFPVNGDKPIVLEEFTSLLTYLNLLIAIKTRLDSQNVKRLSSAIQQKAEPYRNETNNNAIELLMFTLESIQN